MSKWWPVPKALSGDLKFKNHKLPKMMLVGLLGVTFLYISVAGLVSVTTPWLARGDTVQHVDYTWRLWNGDIPRWSDGITYPPFVKLEGHKAEAASANPPLFYMIHAPFVGPLLNGGHWHKAIAVGRAINIFIGVLCIAVLAWAGWLFGGTRRALFAVAVPALSVLMYRFTRLNVDYALDALVVLWATLSLIFNYKILQYGLRRKYLIGLALISVAGMATKAPYIVFLLVSLLAIVIASLMHGKGSTPRRIIKGGLISAGIFALVLAAIGWFYYFRNYKSHGNWFSSSPPGYTGGRKIQSLHDVLTNKKLWGLLYSDFSVSATASVVLVSLALAGWLTTTRKAMRDYLGDRARAIAIGLMALTALGTFIVQIKFATGIGSINFRYLLPAILPISLFLSAGLLAFKTTKGQLVSLLVLAMAASSITSLTSSHFHGLYSATRANGIPGVVVSLLLLLFVLGATCLGWSLFDLSKSRKTTAG